MAHRYIRRDRVRPHAAYRRERNWRPIAAGIGAVAVLLVAAAIFGAIAGRDEPASEPAAAAIGQPVRLERDGWILTVDRVGTTAGIRDHRALGVYVVVDLTMENIGTEAHTLGGNRFTLKDIFGREYPYYLDGTIDIGDGELGSRINPGLKAPATVVFDVPEDAIHLTLTSLGGFQVRLGDVANLGPYAR